MNKPWTIRWTSSEVSYSYRLWDVISAAEIATFVAKDVVSGKGPKADDKTASVEVPTTIFGLRPMVLTAVDSAGAKTASDAAEIDFGVAPPEKPMNLAGEAA